MDAGYKIQDAGCRFKVQGPRIKDQVLRFYIKNDHSVPERDTLHK